MDIKVFEKLLLDNTHEILNIINSHDDISYDQIMDIKNYLIYKGISCSVYDGIIRAGI